MLERGPEGRKERAENGDFGNTQFARPEERQAGKGGGTEGERPSVSSAAEKLGR